MARNLKYSVIFIFHNILKYQMLCKLFRTHTSQQKELPHFKGLNYFYIWGLRGGVVKVIYSENLLKNAVRGNGGIQCMYNIEYMKLCAIQWTVKPGVTGVGIGLYQGSVEVSSLHHRS